MKHSKGFTLIELLITIAIIGILAAIAIPAYLGQQRKGANQEAYANLQSIRVLAEQYYAENGRYEPTAGSGAPIYNFSTANCPNDPALDTATCIRKLYRGFNPGVSANLKFTYSFASCGTGGRGNCAIAGGIAVASCGTAGAAPDDQTFIACAVGKSGTLVGGSGAANTGAQIFWINNLNQNNF